MRDSLCIVRPMTLEDIPAVLAIERLCFSTPWSEASFVREIEENRCARYLVVEAGEETPLEVEGGGLALREPPRPARIVAYGGMWLVIDEAHVTNIAVHPDARGQGFGECVTRALMQLASDTGMVWMTLEVRRSNLTAQKLYRKLGFIDVGYRKRYYEDNHEDALIMACEALPPPAE